MTNGTHEAAVAAAPAGAGYHSVGGWRRVYAEVGDFITKWFFPLGLLGGRIYIFIVFFWLSGLARWNSVFSGSYSTEVWLAENEYPVFDLPGDLVAPLILFAETLPPILLLFGVFGRVNALILLVMAAVIEFHVGGAKPAEFSKVVHYLWMAVLLVLVLRGPGWISVDHLLLRTEKR